MEFLRRAWGEAFNQAYLWALGFLLFTAIMGTMGWNRPFAEKAHSDDRRGARQQANGPGGKKPTAPVDWPSARSKRGGR